jgi:hypothetical protein
MSKSVKSSKFKCLWISYFLPRSRCFLKNAITSRANQIYTFDPFALSSVCQWTGAVISQIANSRFRPVSRSIVAGAVLSRVEFQRVRDHSLGNVGSTEHPFLRSVQGAFEYSMPSC